MEENNEEKKINLEINDETKNEKKLEEKVNISKNEEKGNEGEAKFKKVEINNKNNTKQNKKNHKFLKTILIIIGILVIAYFIFAVRNYYILKDILIKASRFENIESYSYEVNSKQTDVEVNMKYTTKEGIERLDLNNITKSERDLIIWKDKNTGEGIVAFTGMKNAIKSKDEDKIVIGGGNFPFKFSQMNEGMSGLGLFALIYSRDFNGKDCYVVQIADGYKLWVEKETGLVVKEENSGNIEELKSLKLENVEEIYKPDLTGYEITEQ